MSQEPVEKISSEVSATLDEQSVNDSLRDVQALLRSGRTAPRTTRPPRPPSPPRRLARRLLAATPATDWAGTVAAGFRSRLSGLRRLTDEQMKGAVEAFSHALTNLGMGKRAQSRGQSPALNTAPAPPEVRNPPPPRAVPSLPPPVVSPLPPLPPPPAPMPSPVQSIRPVINNYDSQVVIDPRQMKEWREVLAVLRQLKRQNRAAPVPAPGRVKTYEWMSPEEKDDLRKTTFTQAGLLASGMNAVDAMAYLKQQTMKADAYARLDARLRNAKLVQARIVWREERHTRFHPLPGVKAPLGPSGARRKRGQFYFNRRFQGASYSVPTLMRNRALVRASRPAIEAARSRQYQLAGLRGYRLLAAVDTRRVRVFFPSRWGQGKPRLLSTRESVDIIWTRRLGIGLRVPDRSGLPKSLTPRRTRTGTYDPLLKRLLQND